MKTFQLTSDWYLALNASGSLVKLSDKEAILQDVCSAARTW
ncbi:hypothetical protein DM15PD_05440 [Aristophania vespae]|nr:hypothetical protein DM15PD_05440 [Aristophania vespae]